MNLTELHNPKNITGFLLWNNGDSTEISTNEKTAIQETKGRLEVWQQMSAETILKVCQFNKKSITHYVVNNTFIPKN